ncbi:MAG: MBL fold metallo-hydrolase [Eubacteriales bacterium]
MSPGDIDAVLVTHCHTDHVFYSHNVDRYQCPWDIGYDKKTVFYLFSMNDR